MLSFLFGPAFRFLREGAAILLVMATCVLSLLPQDDKLPPGPPGIIQHFVAYFIIGALCTSALKDSTRLNFWLATGLVLLPGLIEIGQALPPGRNPQFISFISSASGALAGMVFTTALFYAVLRLRPDLRPPPESRSRPTR